MMLGNDMMRVACACAMGLLPALSLGQKPAGDWGDLSSYPKGDRVWIGSFGGTVEVNPSTNLLANRYGSLDWKVVDGGTVEEGATLAFQAAEEYQQSLAQLKLDEAKLEVDLAALKWDHEEKNTSLKRKVEELESQLTNLTLTREEKKLVGPELAARLDARRLELQAALEMEREKASPQRRADQLSQAMEQLKLDLTRARWEHQQVIQKVSIIAPHEGILHQLKTGTVQAGDLVGRVERRGLALAKLKVLDPDVRSELPERLAVTVAGPRGQLLSGVYSRTERLGEIGVGIPVYQFDLTAAQGVELDAEMSGERMISMYRLLGQQAYLVPKTKFLFADPEAIENMGWPVYIKTIWPKAKVLYLGPDKIALIEAP